MTGPIHRRRLLSIGGGLSILGATAPFAAQLAAAGSAASQTTSSDYRALVCIFLYGGNDSHNTVVATDQESFDRYTRARNVGPDPIALLRPGAEKIAGARAGSPGSHGGVLTISPLTISPLDKFARPLALHPALDPLRPVFDSKRLAILANVGTLNTPVTKKDLVDNARPYPANLFSHNDQQSTWQAGASEGASVGWGGRLGDIVMGMNGDNALFTAMSTAGNAVFLSGKNVVQYQMNTGNMPAIKVNGKDGMLFGSAARNSRVEEIVKNLNFENLFAKDYAKVTTRSMESAVRLNDMFGLLTTKAVKAPEPFINPITNQVANNGIAEQLYTIARMIAAGKEKGMKRQVFFVGAPGWDSHDDQNIAQTQNLARLAHGMAYFDKVLESLTTPTDDMRANVTTFTASDFSRSFTSNGNGTDHAWGGHHFVMGGAVDGKKVYGTFPILGVDGPGFNNPDMIGGALIPTTSVDQYAATLGRWLGASESELKTIFPNLENFSPNLGFMK